MKISSVSIIIFIFSSSLSIAQVTAPSLTGSAGGGSFTLAQLRDSALQNNIAIRTGRLKMAAAKEQRREAFTKYFPNISGTALTFKANKEMVEMEMNPSEFVSPELKAALGEMTPMLSQIFPMEALASLGNPISMAMMKSGTIAGVNALQPIFAGGQIVIGNKLARIGEEASELQLKLSEKDVEAQVEQYYWQLVSMEEKTRTLNVVDTMLAQILHDVQTAVRAGVAMNNDLLQVQLRQNEIASQRLKLNNGRALVKMLIAQFCGIEQGIEIEMPDMQGIPLPLEAPLFERERSEGTPDRGVRLLPEYQLLEKNFEAAKLQRKMEVAKNLPSIAVGAGYNYHNILDKDRHFGMVFATVNVPVTDWWGGAHAIRRKRFDEQAAREQLIDNAQLLQIRIQKAANDITEAESQLTLTQRSIEQATENLRIQRNTYRAGTSTMTDLLQAQLLLQQAQDKHTDAFIALQNAHTAYRHASGM